MISVRNFTVWRVVVDPIFIPLLVFLLSTKSFDLFIYGVLLDHDDLLWFWWFYVMGLFVVLFVGP